MSGYNPSVQQVHGRSWLSGLSDSPLQNQLALKEVLHEVEFPHDRYGTCQFMTTLPKRCRRAGTSRKRHCASCIFQVISCKCSIEKGKSTAREARQAIFICNTAIKAKIRTSWSRRMHPSRPNRTLSYSWRKNEPMQKQQMHQKNKIHLQEMQG